MILHRHAEDNDYSVQECSEYTPIQVAKVSSVEFGVTAAEDAGCDSCTHCHNGACGVFTPFTPKNTVS